MSESGSGEPVDSSTDSSKNSTVTCPVCGKAYSGASGVGYHMRREHPSELIECDICGELCKSQRGLSVHKTKEHPEVRSPNECEVCGDAYTVKPWREDKARFCSRDCLFEWEREEHYPKLKHDNWFECVVCGEEFRREDSSPYAKCCSTNCNQYYMSKIRVGENNHHWKGGGRQYYGENWHQRREACLERDNHTCQDCGTTEKLHVHHIRPLRTFDVPEEANNLLNLVTLCATCHLSKWEGIPLRPDPR